MAPKSAEDINKSGFRGSEFSIARSDKKRVLMIGDSFIFANNVDYEHTSSNFLDELLGEEYEVYNMGVLGYGPDQTLLQLKNVGMKYRPDTVVLSIFAANDFSDIFKNELYYLDDDGRLMQKKPNMTEKFLNPLRILDFIRWRKVQKGEDDQNLKVLFRNFFQDQYNINMLKNTNSDRTQSLINLMSEILKEFKSMTDNAGIKFLVAIIPSFQNIKDDASFRRWKISPQAYFFLEDTLADICVQQNLQCINLYKNFLDKQKQTDLYEDSSGHLGIEGNRFLAKEIYTVMKEK
jgi:hypothetical protein